MTEAVAQWQSVCHQAQSPGYSLQHTNTHTHTHMRVRTHECTQDTMYLTAH